MGVVYKARDAHLDRPVALKVLPPEKVADPERKRRFIQEAKAASALNHPNIITIHDINCDQGVDFIVMEYIEGQTLDAAIASKGMSERPMAPAGLRRGSRLAAGGSCSAGLHRARKRHLRYRPAHGAGEEAALHPVPAMAVVLTGMTTVARRARS